MTLSPNRCLLAVVAAFVIAWAGPGAALGQGIDDAKVNEARRVFDRWLDEARTFGTTQSQQASQVEALLREIPIRSLTPGQLEKLAKMISFSPTLTKRAQAHADEFANDESSAGAIALTAKAAMEMYSTDGFPKPSQVNAILQHPGLPEALAQGNALEVFLMMRQLEGWGLQPSKPFVLELHNSLRDDAEPETVWYWMNMYPTVVRFTRNTPEIREEIREKLSVALAKALSEARAADEDPVLISRLAERSREFAGFWGRGQLSGVPAPEIDFAYTPQRFRFKKLSDLRGKVVILDFFANWSTPSIAALVPLRQVYQRYRGFDVEVLGVTSLQGQHLQEATMIDTSGNPELEYELMNEFSRDNRVDWPVIFSRFSVMDRAYGVESFPHLVIIDPDGVVRFNRINLLSFPQTSSQGPRDLNPLFDAIDSVLAEFGRRTPG